MLRIEAYVRPSSLPVFHAALIKAGRKLAKEDFDLVIVVYWYLSPMLALFPPDRAVLVTYDIDLHVNRQVSLLERHLFRKLQAMLNCCC